MKNKIFSTISALAVAILIQGCHDPKPLVSNGAPKGILSLTAKIVGDESSDNNFDAIIDYDAQTITVRFPMYYPISSTDELPIDALKNVRLTASLATNASISPALTTMDLTRDNHITVTNAQGVKKDFTVRGDIRPYWECELQEIELSSGISCIVDHETNVVTMLAAESVIEPQTAIVEVSPHATITPDITTQPFDFEAEDASITVTAQNGVDKKVYTFIKGVPNKIPFGMREGSETLRWVKRWNEVGYTAKDKQTGFAVTNDYLILNEEGTMQAVVLDAKKGTDTGKRLDMSIIPAGLNHNMTSDNAGHIIVNSRYGQEPNKFQVWVFNDIDDRGKLLIDQNVYGAGERVSVYGDITKDAVIVTTLNGTTIQAVRWFIKDGNLMEPNTLKSEIFTLGGITATPWGNADIAPTSATSSTADYFATFYAPVNGKRGPVLYDGTNNTVKAYGLPNTKKRNEPDGGFADAGNWIMNACDYVEFNKNKYLFHNSVNTFPWGENDMLFLLDVTSGLLDNEIIGDPTKGLDVQFKYGAMAAGNTGIAGNCNDVRLWVDNSGFFMYGYFLFTNGYIGCIRMDCIDK